MTHRDIWFGILFVIISQLKAILLFDIALADVSLMWKMRLIVSNRKELLKQKMLIKLRSAS